MQGCCILVQRYTEKTVSANNQEKKRRQTFCFRFFSKEKSTVPIWIQCFGLTEDAYLLTGRRVMAYPPDGAS